VKIPGEALATASTAQPASSAPALMEASKNSARAVVLSFGKRYLQAPQAKPQASVNIQVDVRA
jgi:hypothetical protein